MFWPRAAAQMVAMSMPIEGADSRIGSAAPAAEAGKAPMVTSPRPVAPAMTLGMPTIAGSPFSGLGSGGASLGDGESVVVGAWLVVFAVMVCSCSGPEETAGSVRAFSQAEELFPGDGRKNGQERGEGRKATVGAGHHTVPPDDPGEPDDALGDQVGMLDVVAGGVDHAGDERQRAGNGDVLEDAPFVGVPGVGVFETERADVGAGHDGEDLAEFDVVVMRSFVVAPADVQPDPVGVDALESVVQHLDVAADPPDELVAAGGRALHVTAHGQVGTVQLEVETSVGDGPVLHGHRLGQRFKVGVVARGIAVLQEDADHAGGRRGNESASAGTGQRLGEVVEIHLDGLLAGIADRTVAGWHLGYQPGEGALG